MSLPATRRTIRRRLHGLCYTAGAIGVLLARPLPAAAQYPAGDTASSATAAPDSVLAAFAHREAAREARQAKNYPLALDQLRQAWLLQPGHPGILYALAAASALAGDSAGAYRWLERYAEYGWSRAPSGDPDFVSLRGRSRFDATARRIALNGVPRVRSDTAFVLRERELFPEGIAFDPRSRYWFVGSVRNRKIVRVDASGGAEDFAAGEWELGSVLGMQVDTVRGILWAASAALPQMREYQPTDSGTTALFAFDVRSGHLVGRYPVPRDGVPHLLGDLVVSRGGDVYASDARGSRIYRLRRGADGPEVLVDSPLLISSQGLALSSDERALFVADYARGILRIDLRSRRIARLGHDEAISPRGIDGLYRDGPNLIAIQNGTDPVRIVRLRLNGSGTRITGISVLESANPAATEPTLGVLVGGELFFVANSPWSHYDEAGRLRPNHVVPYPLILRLPLAE